MTTHTMTKSNSKLNVRKLTMTAMLGAVATVLMFLDFSVPFMPSFLKLDVSELPALIGSFSLGPVSGVAVCFIKNALNLIRTTTGGVGELCNFLLGLSFVLPAGLIYKKMKNKKGAIIGAISGSAIMAIVSIFINYYISYPMYEKFMSMDAIMGAYQAIYSGVDSLIQALLVFNTPFTFLKGLLCTVITILVYKRLSPILKGTNNK